MVNSNRSPYDRRSRRLAAGALMAFVVFMAVVCWFVGRPLVRFVSEPELFRQWVDKNGIWGRIAFLGMVVFQVIIAIIPGEPLEIGAGYAFGAVEGTGLFLLGATIGSTVVFLLVRKFGGWVVEAFFSREKIRSLKFMQNSRRLNLIAFIVMFIPGTPKDLISYFMGLTDMRLGHWILITFFARIPSVITSTIGGNALGLQDYSDAIIAFAVMAAISALGILIYRKISKIKSEKK